MSNAQPRGFLFLLENICCCFSLISQTMCTRICGKFITRSPLQLSIYINFCFFTVFLCFFASHHEKFSRIVVVVAFSVYTMVRCFPYKYQRRHVISEPLFYSLGRFRRPDLQTCRKLQFFLLKFIFIYTKKKN